MCPKTGHNCVRYSDIYCTYIYKNNIVDECFLIYSQHPKTELQSTSEIRTVRISDTFPSSRLNLCSVLKVSEIRTNLFGFQTFGFQTITFSNVRTFGFRTFTGVLYITSEIRTLFCVRFYIVRTVQTERQFVRISASSDNRTFGFRTFGWLTVRVRTFGFRTFGHFYTMNAEIQTELSVGFQTFGFWTLGLVRTHDRSDFGVVRNPNVWISDVDCTPIFGHRLKINLEWPKIQSGQPKIQFMMVVDCI